MVLLVIFSCQFSSGQKVFPEPLQLTRQSSLSLEGSGGQLPAPCALSAGEIACL